LWIKSDIVVEIVFSQNHDQSCSCYTVFNTSYINMVVRWLLLVIGIV